MQGSELTVVVSQVIFAARALIFSRPHCFNVLSNAVSVARIQGLRIQKCGHC